MIDAVDATESKSPAAGSSFRGGEVSFGPRVGAVFPVGDLGDLFSGGWTAGGEILVAIEPQLSFGATVSYSSFSPEQLFEAAGLDLDLAIAHVGVSFVGFSSTSEARTRFFLSGGLGVYRLYSTLSGNLTDPDGVSQSVNLDDSATEIGLEAGVGVLIVSERGSPGIRIVSAMTTLFDKETDGVDSYGPSRYFRLGINLDLRPSEPSRLRRGR